MTNIVINCNNLEIKVELEDDTTSTEMIESFCRILLLQGYQIGSIIDSLGEVKEDLIEEVKLAYEDISDE